jgi:hypothetical protein
MRDARVVRERPGAIDDTRDTQGLPTVGTTRPVDDIDFAIDHAAILQGSAVNLQLAGGPRSVDTVGDGTGHAVSEGIPPYAQVAEEAGAPGVGHAVP